MFSSKAGIAVFSGAFLLAACGDMQNVTAPGEHSQGGAVLAGGPPSSTSATGTLEDLLADGTTSRVRSDGRGTYVHTVECVSVLAGSNGFYQLRPVSNGGFTAIGPDGNPINCNLQTWDTPSWPSGNGRRFASLDFNDPAAGSTANTSDIDLRPGDLDQTIEEAPVRFMASEFFARKATSTPVEILVQVVRSDGTTTQETKWKAVYRERAPIQVIDSSTRILSLTRERSIADFYEVTGRTNNGTDITVFKGAYHLPFRLQATR
jgi:hypothetical protein